VEEVSEAAYFFCRPISLYDIEDPSVLTYSPHLLKTYLHLSSLSHSPVGINVFSHRDKLGA
jgi:hypothetical protein